MKDNKWVEKPNRESYERLLVWLSIAIQADVQFYSSPSLGCVMITSKRRLTDNDVKPFGFTLSGERQWVRDEYCYETVLTNESAKLIVDWAEKNPDSWTRLINLFNTKED